MNGKITLTEVKQICDELYAYKDAASIEAASDKILSNLEVLSTYPFQKDDLPKTKIILVLKMLGNRSTNSTIKTKAEKVTQYVKEAVSEKKIPSRTPSSEQIGQHEKFQKRICALFLENGVEEKKANVLAATITDEIFLCPDPSTVYQERYSALGKKDLNYIQQLAEGSITAKEFIQLPSDRLLSKQEKEEENKKEAISQTTVPKPIPSVSALFTCPVCHSKEVTHYQLQTRSADEPMTNFLTCQNCGKEWRQY